MIAKAQEEGTANMLFQTSDTQAFFSGGGECTSITLSALWWNRALGCYWDDSIPLEVYTC
jgi:hypothetical protein